MYSTFHSSDVSHSFMTTLSQLQSSKLRVLKITTALTRGVQPTAHEPNAGREAIWSIMKK